MNHRATKCMPIFTHILTFPDTGNKIGFPKGMPGHRIIPEESTYNIPLSALMPDSLKLYSIFNIGINNL